MRFETFWFWLKANVTGIGLCPTFHYLSPIRSFLVEQDRTGVRGGKHGRCSRDIRIYQPYLRNDIAFVSSDICLMFGIEKRRNERIKRLPEIRWKSCSKTMEQKRMLNLLWNHFEGRIIKHVYRRILSIWKELYVLYITIDKRSFHSSSHLGIILWPLPFLLAIFPLERDFVSFENWDFFFRHGQGL